MAYAMSTLEIFGYRNESVPNTFFRHEEISGSLTIVLPGFAYTCDMPLLYYPVLSMLDAGADVLQVEYAYYRRESYRALPDEERDRWLFTDVAAACDAILIERAYTSVTFIGKSIGTRAIGHLLTTDAHLTHARVIWLTPLLRNERLRTQMRHRGGASLIVIGTADPHFDETLIAEVQEATGGNAVIIEGADHSLEIAGDVLGSLDAVAQTMRTFQAFLANSERSMP